CYWSDESEYVDGAPEVSECPPTPNERVPFCGGPCGECDTRRWRWNGAYSPRAGCTGMSETRGFGVCTFAGGFPCSREDPGATVGCEQSTDWGEPCACLLLQLPDGSFQEIGFPTLASSCLEYQAHFPEGVRCMDPFEWTELTR